jgi:hypothetical protein
MSETRRRVWNRVEWSTHYEHPAPREPLPLIELNA